jgi:anti-anti-sigma factor
MAMTVTQQINEDTAHIILKGRFDFSSHRDFRQGYEQSLHTPDIKVILVDLDGVEYIDSSALGMLLLLREKALQAGIEVKLANCKGAVLQVLEVANFGRLFNIG